MKTKVQNTILNPEAFGTLTGSARDHLSPIQFGVLPPRVQDTDEPSPIPATGEPAMGGAMFGMGGMDYGYGGGGMDYGWGSVGMGQGY
jgi:hypothetical protein